MLPNESRQRNSDLPRPDLDQPQTADWTVSFHPKGDLPPLFCPSAGGGSAEDYRDLAQSLPEDQPVHAFALPPIRERPAFPTVEQLAAIFIDKMRQIQPHGPYRICGYSFGGLVAYEMASLLTSAGETVAFLGLLDTEHPACGRNLSGVENIRFQLSYLLDRLTKYWRNLLSGRIDYFVHDARTFIYTRLLRLGWRLFYQVGLRYGWAAPKVTENNELVLAAAWGNYNPPRYNGPIVLFNATGRTIEYSSDPSLGWRACTGGLMKILSIPGEHKTILRPPNVPVLANQLMACIVAPAGPPRCL